MYRLYTTSKIKKQRKDFAVELQVIDITRYVVTKTLKINMSHIYICRIYSNIAYALHEDVNSTNHEY